MQKDFPRILVGSPVNKVKAYCLFKWLIWTQSFSYPNYDIFLSDNSEDEDFHKELQKVVDCGYSSPKGKRNIQYVCDSQNQLRMRAMKGGYDYLLHLECDQFPPLNIIEALYEHRKPVVSAPYFWDLGEYSRLLLQDVVKERRRLRVYSKEYTDAFLFADGQVKRIYSAGLGCTLIHKSIFSKLPFRVMPNEEGHADSFFSLDLHRGGVKQFVDTSIMVRHMNQGWHDIKQREIIA